MGRQRKDTPETISANAGNRETQRWVGARLLTLCDATVRLCEHTDRSSVAIDAVGDINNVIADLFAWLETAGEKAQRHPRTITLREAIDRWRNLPPE